MWRWLGSATEGEHEKSATQIAATTNPRLTECQKSFRELLSVLNYPYTRTADVYPAIMKTSACDFIVDLSRVRKAMDYKMTCGGDMGDPSEMANVANDQFIVADCAEKIKDSLQGKIGLRS